MCPDAHALIANPGKETKAPMSSAVGVGLAKNKKAIATTNPRGTRQR
jgi:hypothetical protein